MPAGGGELVRVLLERAQPAVVVGERLDVRTGVGGGNVDGRAALY